MIVQKLMKIMVLTWHFVYYTYCMMRCIRWKMFISIENIFFLNIRIIRIRKMSIKQRDQKYITAMLQCSGNMIDTLPWISSPTRSHHHPPPHSKNTYLKLAQYISMAMHLLNWNLLTWKVAKKNCFNIFNGYVVQKCVWYVCRGKSFFFLQRILCWNK